mgnify:CR=1 FL=1
MNGLASRPARGRLDWLAIIVAIGLLAACGPVAEGARPSPTTAATTPRLAATSPAPAASPTPAPAPQATERASPPTATATGAGTTIVDYQPERPDGEALAATCWTNSLVVPSRTAWRCEAEGRSLEPCFALDSTSLVCNPNPLTGDRGVLVRLSRPLPPPDLIAEKPNSAWLLQLADGAVCTLLPGATGLVDGKRIGYWCFPPMPSESQRVVILGEPKQGALWSVEKATLTVKDGKWVAASSAVLAVQKVVRPPSAYAPYACERLAGVVAAVLGVDIRATQAPFLDPNTGQRGTGCQLNANWPGTVPGAGPEESVVRLFVGQGWREDGQYRGAGASHSATALRKADVLCLVNATWNNARGYDLNLACARDRTLGQAPGLLFRAPQQIMFPHMGTASSLRGSVGAGQIQEYLLTAFAGQTMILELRPSQPAVHLAVSGWDDDAALLPPSANATRWHGLLPTTQDYLITVAARGQAAEFTLDVIIPETLVPQAGHAATSLRQLPADQRAHYLVVGEAGQKLSLNLRLAEGQAALAVTGLEDRNDLLPASARLTSWSMALPRSQPYLIEVIPDGGPVRYSLELGLE